MTNEKSKFNDFAGKLVNFGKANGATQISVSIGSSTDFSVEVRNGKIEKLEEAFSTGLSLKVIVDAKVATASSSDLSQATMEKMIVNAIERAKLSSPDPFGALPELEQFDVDVDSLKLYDPNIESYTPEKKIAAAKELEKMCLADIRIKMSNGSGYSTSSGEVVLVNSNGFSGSYRTTSCSIGISLQTGEKDKMVEDGWYDYSLYLSDLMPVEKIAEKAIFRTTRLVGGKKVKSDNFPVVFEPTMTASILGFLSACINGSSIYMRRSFLAGKIGKKIANPLINIVNDGLLPTGRGSRPFDGEGVPCRKFNVVETGMLKNYLLGTYSARKLNMKSTGNASGPNNLYLANGPNSPEDIIKSVDDGLYLTKTIGQGTVPSTGDISKGAYGIWIEKGKLTYPVSEITISGNLGKILNDIVMIGNDNEFRSSISGPTIKVKEMTISGN